LAPAKLGGRLRNFALFANFVACHRLSPHAYAPVAFCRRQARIHYFKYFKKEFLDNVREIANEEGISFLSASEKVRSQPWQRNNIVSFSNSVSRLSNQYRNGASLATIIDNIINIISLNTYLTDIYTNPDELTERLESVENLKKFIRSNTVDSFLKFVYENDDHKKKNDNTAVQMMTVHKSKGLEFKQVFVVGIKDGKFPSSKSDLLEEARLFYVAVTRPKDSLYLSQTGASTFINQYLGDSEII
jgi:DNA helicase-2/ATP-dependent DNA helicase PcrA